MYKTEMGIPLVTFRMLVGGTGQNVLLLFRVLVTSQRLRITYTVCQLCLLHNSDLHCAKRVQFIQS